MPVPVVTYSATNSGGRDWLNLEDWLNLQKAGWLVFWYRPEFAKAFGLRAYRAIKVNCTEDEAIEEWIEITGQDPDEEGCPCCGSPHNFYDYPALPKEIREAQVQNQTVYFGLGPNKRTTAQFFKATKRKFTVPVQGVKTCQKKRKK